MTATPEAPEPRRSLSALLEPFDSVPNGYLTADVDDGYSLYGRYFEANYMRLMPENRDSVILCVSCGPGYYVKRLREMGYTRVLGIDSDPAKVEHANRRGLDCLVAEAFPFLEGHRDQFDAIWCGNEINHLSKSEAIEFLQIAKASLRPGGLVIIQSQNGANPITGMDGLAHNLDHQAIYTDYSLRQLLEYTGFTDVEIKPMRLYVFYRNPLNYLGMAAEAMLTLFFRLCFKLYAKEARIFTKKIIGIGYKR